MRKSILATLVLSALALGLSACNVSAGPDAARVGDSGIPVSSLNAVLDAVRADPELACVFGGQGVAYEGAGTGNFNSTFTSERLSDLIQLKLEDGLIDELGLLRVPFAKTTATEALDGDFDPQNVGSCDHSGAQFLAALPRAYALLLTQTEVDQIVLDAHLSGLTLTPAGIADYEEAHRGAMSNSCISVILVSTKEKASALADEIRNGASFASLAKANSMDTSSAADGGAIDCTSANPSPIVPNDLQPPVGEVAGALPTGTVSMPVPFDGNWVLLEVTSRQGLATATDALSSIIDSENAPTNTAVARYAARVGVEVNPTYGSASVGNSGSLVDPPVGPSDSLLLNPKALTPPTAG